MEAQLDPIIQAAVDSKQIPGAAAIALDASGKVLFSKGYGHTKIDDASSPLVTPDTPCLVWSCTKLVISVAALQLVEHGKIDLHAPAEKYVPDIAKIQVLHGFNDDGTPNLKPAQTKPTVLHLITHTAGFSYDFFDPSTLQWRVAMKQPPVSYVSRSAMEDYTTPLIFEPGKRYEYGVSIDWLGFVVEKVSGQDLEAYFKEHIFKPLGMINSGTTLTAEQDAQFLTVHAKDADGKLSATPIRFTPTEVKAPGGHCLYSTCNEYAQFLLTLINAGTHPVSKAQILKPETVKNYVFQDMISVVGCSPDGLGNIPSTVAPISCTGNMLPGVKKGWSCGLLLNNEAMPNGRSQGSGAWAGLGNCYYWVDPAAGHLGFIVSAIVPFFDKDVLHLFDALERAVYGKPMAKTVGEAGSNFEGGNYKL